MGHIHSECLTTKLKVQLLKISVYSGKYQRAIRCDKVVLLRSTTDNSIGQEQK